MIHLSSGAKIFGVSSPQVSLSVSKNSFWSHLYFLSIGSFKMVKNHKKLSTLNEPFKSLLILFLDVKVVWGEVNFGSFGQPLGCVHLSF